MKRNLSNVLILMALWVVSLLVMGVIARMSFEIVSLGWNTAGWVSRTTPSTTSSDDEFDKAAARVAAQSKNPQ